MTIDKASNLLIISSIFFFMAYTPIITYIGIKFLMDTSFCHLYTISLLTLFTAKGCLYIAQVWAINRTSYFAFCGVVFPFVSFFDFELQKSSFLLIVQVGKSFESLSNIWIISCSVCWLHCTILFLRCKPCLYFCVS